MNGYISIILLISVVLTIHGIEQHCRVLCENICQQQENTSGQDCCRASSGTYLDGTYDNACKNGRCILGCMYMTSLEFMKAVNKSWSLKKPSNSIPKKSKRILDPTWKMTVLTVLTFKTDKLTELQQFGYI